MRIIKMEVGQLGANCYIAYCLKTQQGFVVDPGGDGEQINAVLEEQKLDIKYIINTHGHADHIAANDIVKAATGAKVLIHSSDAGMLTSAQGNLSVYVGGSLVCQAADEMLSDSDKLTIGDLEVEVLHTPGHTPGGVCLKIKECVFTGDTLFEQSVGRTDFPGGSHQQLISSIKNKLFVLPDGVTVLPGHGPATRIGDERRHNPFVR